MAFKKGLKSITWRIYTAIAWIISEIIGLMVGFLFFDKDNLFSIGLVGLTFAITSYFIIKAQLNKLPDYDDEIDSIGSN